jgi:hypothetical protein
MKKSAIAAIRDSEAIMLGKETKEHMEVLAGLDGNKYVVDLTKIVSNTKAIGDFYEGICW